MYPHVLTNSHTYRNERTQFYTPHVHMQNVLQRGCMCVNKWLKLIIAFKYISRYVTVRFLS